MSTTLYTTIAAKQVWRIYECHEYAHRRGGEFLTEEETSSTPYPGVPVAACRHQQQHMHTGQPMADNYASATDKRTDKQTTDGQHQCVKPPL